MSSAKPKAAPRATPVLPPKLGAGSAGEDTRRSFIGKLTIAAVAASCGVPLAMSVRSVVPNMLYEPPMRLKVGPLERFTEGATYLANERAFLFREQETLYSISARCTHLGCTVQLAKMPNAEGGFEFHCPCHGSKFRADGTNFAGPAPSPLPYYKLDLAADDGQLILDMSESASKGWRLTVRS
jgi:menaquinol-cytochrome c reductase iron-sulfur subunit